MKVFFVTLMLLLSSRVSCVPTLEPSGICHGRFLEYATHSGWGNQLIQLAHALALSKITNRTLLLPPVMPHSRAVPYGSCSKSVSPPDVVRKHSHKAVMSMRIYLEMQSVLNITILNSIAPTVDYRLWHRTCGKHLQEEDVVVNTHDCQDHLSWVHNRSIIEGKEPPLPEGQLPLDLDELVEESRKLLAFGSVYDVRMFQFAASILPSIEGNLVYHKDLWVTPCQISQSLYPFAAIHIRGGDGPFHKDMKRRHETIRSQFEKIAESILIHGSHWTTTTCGTTASFTIFVMSDIPHEKFLSSPAWLEGTERVELVLRRMKHALKFAAIRAGSSFENTDSIEQHGTRFMIQDVMVATLADTAFANFEGSTLSSHIIHLRSRWNVNNTCTADLFDDTSCNSNISEWIEYIK